MFIQTLHNRVRVFTQLVYAVWLSKLDHPWEESTIHMRFFHNFFFILSRDLNRIIEISCTKTYSSNETKAFHVEAYFSNNKQSTIKERQKKTKGSTGIWTQVARFKVWSANHYTMEPLISLSPRQILYILNKQLLSGSCSW